MLIKRWEGAVYGILNEHEVVVITLGIQLSWIVLGMAKDRIGEVMIPI